MANVVKEDIQVTIARILEDWGLMLVDRAESVQENFDQSMPFYCASIDFTGIVNGTYHVVCQETFARALAANLLGMDSEISEADQQDVLRELINVLSGNLLTASYGEDTVFDLSEPTVIIEDGEGISKMHDQKVFSFVADCEPVFVSFSLGDRNAN